MKNIISQSILVMVLVSTSIAGNYEDGVQAADAGDFKRAYQFWFIDALEGDVRAQHNLGFMYKEGHGVTEDYVEAYAWWVLAAANGNERARANMMMTEEVMLSYQIEKAQQLAKEFYERIR